VFKNRELKASKKPNNRREQRPNAGVLHEKVQVLPFDLHVRIHLHRVIHLLRKEQVRRKVHRHPGLMTVINAAAVQADHGVKMNMK